MALWVWERGEPHDVLQIRLECSLLIVTTLSKATLISGYVPYSVKTVSQLFVSLRRKLQDGLKKMSMLPLFQLGGGFVNVENIKAIGTVVYLHSDFDSIIKSIKSHPNAEKKIKKRPLLQDMEAARKLYNTRLPIYRRVADVEVFMADRPVARVAEEIVERVKMLKLKKS